MKSDSKIQCGKHIVIRALGSSGSSWLSLLLSSHAQRFYVGPPDRLWGIEKVHAGSACMVHGAKCDFLPDFIASLREEGSFAEQLEAALGDRSLVLFNPSPAFEKEELGKLKRPVVNLVLLRDIRAVAFSLMRHNRERFPNAVELVRKALMHRVNDLRHFLKSPTTLVMRYEDIVESPVVMLRQIGDFCGTSYDESALRFWEYAHHMTAGNTGTIDLLRRMQGFDGYHYQRKAYYDEVLADMKEDPSKPKLDLSWTRELQEDDAMVIDGVFGELYQSFGYPRGEFSGSHDECALRESVLHDLPEFQSANAYWKRRQNSL